MSISLNPPPAPTMTITAANWSQRSVQDLLDAAHIVALTQAQRVDRKKERDE